MQTSLSLFTAKDSKQAEVEGLPHKLFIFSGSQFSLIWTLRSVDGETIVVFQEYFA